jgi:hypothetical protein
VPFTAYVEYAGRDSFHFEVYRLRETSLAVGLHFPQLFNRFDFTAEVAQWQDAWYVDYVWLDGMVNDDFVVGGWGGDWRTYNNAVGAQSAMASLEWPLVSGDSVYVRYRTLQNQNYFGIDYDRAYMATVEYSQPRGAFTRGLQLDTGRDVYGDAFVRLSAFLRFTPENEVGDDTTGDYQDDDADDADTANVPKGLERFVDAGVSFGRFGMNVNFSTPKTYQSGTAPHLGIGVRRAVSDNNDFGVRAEFDEIQGRQMYEVRALDWRYRFGQHLAAGLYIGFADYQAPTPAQGYYAGGGVQWRSILPGWDLSFDLRDFDRIQRNKLLPSDGPTNGSVDEFWTMFGMSLYLSRHF